MTSSDTTFKVGDQADLVEPTPVDWAGRTLGQLTPAERRQVTREAARQVEAELTALAPVLAAELVPATTRARRVEAIAAGTGLAVEAVERFAVGVDQAARQVEAERFAGTICATCADQVAPAPFWSTSTPGMPVYAGQVAPLAHPCARCKSDHGGDRYRLPVEGDQVEAAGYPWGTRVWIELTAIEAVQGPSTLGRDGLAAVAALVRTSSGDRSWLDVIDWPELSGWYPTRDLAPADQVEG